MKSIFFFLSLCIFSFSHAQVFVKSDAQGANNGTSWQDAYVNLDSAINRTTTGQIWIAAGTYRPSLIAPTSFKTFYITKKIGLYGGFNGTETSFSQRDIDRNMTILSGDIGVQGNDLDNTSKVITIGGDNLDSNTVIDGITVTKCYYKAGYGVDYQCGAIYIWATGTPVVRNCTIKDNFGFWGAAVYVRSARALIANNLIINNTAYEGAGIYLDYQGDAQVISNRIINNQCIGGYTHLSGGGIQIQAYCSPYINGNLIDNNSSGTYGGGISAESNYSAVISNNVISNNTSRDGGGVYIDYCFTQLTNNLIINNHSTNSSGSGGGGGVFIHYSPNINAINNTFANNYSDGYGGAAYISDGNMNWINNIIYNNPTRYGVPINIVVGRRDWFSKFQYNDIENGLQGISISDVTLKDSIWRTGNQSGYPLFIDTATSNYQLPSQSVCINTGKPDTTGLSIPPTDILGNNRVAAGTIDMGCYEFNGSSNAAYLAATPSAINVNGRSDSTLPLQILSNTSWSTLSKPDWVNSIIIAGSNNASVPITVLANPSLTTARSGKILLLSTGALIPSFTIRINQTGAAFLSTTPDTIYINSQNNDSSSFTVNSNLNWYTNANQPWLSLSRYAGSLSNTVIVKAQANLTSGNRTAKIITYSNYVGINPSKSDTVIVIQRSSFVTLCPNGSTTLPSSLTGTMYQWQLDSGTGFANVIDNATYSGANTNTLSLTNIPSSAAGYKYRCIVDGAASNVYTLKFVNNWLGAVNTAWENPANWSCGMVPDSNTDVVISSGTVVINSNVTIRSLALSPTVTFTVNAGYTLTVTH